MRNKTMRKLKKIIRKSKRRRLYGGNLCAGAVGLFGGKPSKTKTKTKRRKISGGGGFIDIVQPASIVNYFGSESYPMI